MKKLLLVALITLSLVGCASTSDVANVQTQVDGLKTAVADVTIVSQEALNSANTASASATAALKAAQSAEQAAKDTNDKLDAAFKKAMEK